MARSAEVSVLIASSFSTLASAPAVLVTLIAELLLLALRSWAVTTRLELTRQVHLLLDGTIVALGLMFLLLVFLRFVTIG
jgi:hypothetical protein